jgi:hypothetical protein
MLMKFRNGVLALVYLAYLPTTPSATAITVELAEKCTALTNKAFPWRVPDNPAAGRTNGSPKQARDYYNICVAKNGRMGEEQLPRPESEISAPNGSREGEQTSPRRRTFPDGLL